MNINSGDTAWLLVSSALVLLMTPGLALFYGGMVRSKSVLNMMMMSFGSMATIGVVWVLWGYGETFGPSLGGLLGDPRTVLGLEGLLRPDAVIGTVPAMAFVLFQAMFAIIAVALISGAIADRARFATWMVFTVVWAALVYFPIAHWVFAFDAVDRSGVVTRHGGWIANTLKALDFAGGTAIHINAGAAALALVVVLGNRHGFGQEPMRPHNLTLVMTGAGLLWFGWFGFNAGSALTAGTTAAVAAVNTLAATSAACCGWLAAERVRDGHPTSLGSASGIVAGLVAITPGANAVTPAGAVAIGAITGAACAYAVGLKNRFGYDDSLDVVGVHLVGGLVGTILIGFFASASAPAGVDGLLYGGGADQLLRQLVGALAVLVASFGATWVIGFVLDKTMGFRIDRDAELEGIDIVQHAESAYELHGAGGRRTGRGVADPPDVAFEPSEPHPIDPGPVEPGQIDVGPGEPDPIDPGAREMQAHTSKETAA